MTKTHTQTGEQGLGHLEEGLVLLLECKFMLVGECVGEHGGGEMEDELHCIDVSGGETEEEEKEEM